MYLSTKMSKEARIQLFSFVGCLVLQKYAMGLQSNLSGKGNRKQEGEISQMKLIFTSFGTQRKRRGAAVGTAGTASVFSLLILLAESGTHTGISVAAVLLILAGQLDVHLKLSVVPNCVLSVMIVQIVQIVYFYFGVFD